MWRNVIYYYNAIAWGGRKSYNNLLYGKRDSLVLNFYCMDERNPIVKLIVREERSLR